MTHPRRLIEESELFAKLVAGGRERPSPEELPRLLRAIDGLPDAAFAPRTATSGLRKWIVVATAALLVTAGVLVATDKPSASRSTSSAPNSGSTAAVTAPGRAADPPAGEAIPSIAVRSLPDVPLPVETSNGRIFEQHRVRTPAPAPSSSSTSSSHSRSVDAESSKSSLRREVEIIVAARRALTSGDAKECLSMVALYQREFPSGQFALEAKVMRIEAVAASGERARAAVLARELLEREPQNPYQARLRTLLTDIEER